nr:zinc ribbon domain-containing protein [Clostridium beijerinckii]
MSHRKKYKGYKCTNSQQGSRRCSPHSVKETRLIDIISNEIKNMIDEKIDKNKVYDRFSNIKIENNFENELKSAEKELNTLDGKFKKIYEDKLEGVLNQRNFDYMLQDIQEKQDKLIQRKNQLVNMLKKNNDGSDLLNKYKIEIDNLLEGKTIDRRLVETLVDKIVIDEVDGSKEKK